VEAFLNAEEPITVEVLRRPAAGNNKIESKNTCGGGLISSSVPASHRNSVYIPPQSPASSLKETVSVLQTAEVHDVFAPDHESDDEDMILDDCEANGSSGDLLVPGLDYEVSPNKLYGSVLWISIINKGSFRSASSHIRN
jgi:hypothetical protein